MADGKMSQDDIDAILAQMGGDAAPASASASPTAAAAQPPESDIQALAAEVARPLPDASRTVISQAEIDQALEGIDTEQIMALSRPPAQQPVQTTQAGAAPLTGNGSIEQGDLDQLLAAMNATPESPAAPTQAAPAPTAAAGPMGQDDIDALLAQLNDSDPTPSAPAPSAPVPASDGSIDQNDIDDLLAQLAGGQPAPVAASPPASAPAPAADGPLGQDDIDAMIAQMAGGDPVQAVAPAPPAAKSETNGPLGQDDIDAMIAQMAGGGPVQAVAPAPPAAKSETSGPLGQDDIDAMLAQMEAAAPAAPAAPVKASKPPAAVESAQGPLDQNSIDTLLAQLGANTEAKVGAAPKAAGPGAPPLASKAAADLSLTTEDLQSLVAKHEGQAGNPASDTMIAQADIDALVQQLAMATGGEAGAPNEALGEALAKHEAAIDRLLGDAQNAAVDPTDVIPGVGSKPKAPAPVVHAPHGPGQGGPGWSGPVMAPLEIRGARWLLMAAVLLLGICAATLVGVTASIHRLTGELKAERVAQMGDGVGAPGVFADDYQSAMALLEDSDAERQAKGELFLARLKPRHPAHAVEISLVLARHFRAHQAWRPALREYAEVVEGSRRLLDDPRIYLEYAEVLSAVGDRDAALRTIYLPLANESAYTGERDLRRALRPAREAAANRVALQECQLLLGRMLGDRRGPALALGEPHAAAPAHGHEAPAPAQGSH